MTTTPHLEMIAKILRADRRMLEMLADRMRAAAGHDGVFERIGVENDRIIAERLSVLGLDRNASAKQVYAALIRKVEADDQKLFRALNRPVCDGKEGCQSILETARQVAMKPTGFFLKRERAAQLLASEPPKQVMGYLGYKTVADMLAKENLFEVFSALRFLEAPDWLNDTFFKQYASLTPNDFEERPVEVIALSEKWIEATRKFVEKKYHNISHLKELGVVFVIPISLGIPGELLRMFSLIFHYLHEVPYYSKLFKTAAQTPDTFAASLTSFLRGDVPQQQPLPSNKAQWLVVQRYLAKDDENDWRLFFPHINPEALHWLRASQDIVRLGSRVAGLDKDLAFWSNLDWVGDYFKGDAGVPILVSFNLVDTVMSLVKKKELIKYLYHHQEALWNKIFIEYFNIDILDQTSRDNVVQGWFEV